MTLPNAIIVGVNKAGTTSLFHALAGHPGVTPATVKETHFFDPVKYGEALPDLGEYASFFPARAAGPVVLEATPGYFYGGSRLARVLDGALPGVRTVLVLREPGARAFSWWRFCRSRLLVDPEETFGQYLRRCAALGDAPERSRDLVASRALSGGRYSAYLPHWREVLGQRLLVLFHDDLVEDPGGTLARVCTHLDLPPGDHEVDRRDNVTTDVANRTLQRTALAVNRAGERLWRSAPGLKSSARALYYKVNARPQQDRLSAEDRAWLTNHFSEEVAALRVQLAASSVLPAWMRE
jgi:hypothetical protein